MPSLYNATIIFEGSGVGWTERYTINAETTGLPSPPAVPNWNSMTLLDSYFDQLVQKRRLLLGKEYNIIAQKISEIPSTQRSRLGYRFYQGNQTLSAEDPHTDLVVSCDNIDDSRHKITHMGGIPDGIVIDGGVYSDAPAGWLTNWNAYTGHLLAGAYGWYGKNVKLKANLTQYVQQALTGLVVIDLEDTIFDTIAPGTLLEVRIARCTPAEINGALLVRVVNSSRCETVKRISLFTYQSGGTLSFTRNAFIKYAQVRPQKIGRRPRGAPLYHLRGRARARIRG